MTTEREFAEWMEKIRRVRGQTPKHRQSGDRKRSVWPALILFFASLAIALAISHHRESRQVSPAGQLNLSPASRL